MPNNLVVRVNASSPTLQAGLQAIAQELELPGEFPADVTAAAEQAAADVVLPELDRTDLPFITIDPAGSMDLDQAVHVERAGSGFVVHYAIADVAAFVRPGDPVDLEANRRGETLYGAGTRIPLHPPALSEAAASLLPEQVRPALLWTIEVDAAGALGKVHVERARVRSTARWSYVDAQAALDDGTAGEVLLLLREVGRLREQQEVDRGGISLPLPEQEIDESDGSFRLVFRQQLPVEQWNAQISLLTGIGAASLMVGAKVGLLRTLPPPDPRDVARLRRVAKGLRVDWPSDWEYPELVRSLDPTISQHQAMVVACTRLLRGSGYAAFDGQLPEQTRHSAIAAEYAHVTAPLRRLGDRYAGETCLAICAGTPVPDWVREALPGLPKTLQDSARRASAYGRAVLDLVEAAVLADRVGEEFDGVVTSVREDDPAQGVVVLAEVGVEAPVSASQPLPLGEDVKARLTTADVAARKVAFTVA
ncbi:MULTISPECIES: RNB domain-containing ribonuclease [unclassified Nocardioides]|uniref:RNB domain-containing ribonuclease n=1 Tax=unclassified Nocardioides TaxID=2615069 RepID=UPI00070392E0|nr:MULTISPECIES: RNB domain-containing ribonuclease [unclassified Nocardioides]KRC48730.1 ribonuclease II [Nocardioides sp. Root79]KRC75130.1 ribonuclease II [Nocardioides sp. Root240]